jgi:HAMP domain-containing protein
MDDTIRTTFKRELEALATIRDELKLKAHLAQRDVQDELDQLEKKWRLAEEELERTKAHTKSEIGRIGQDVKALVQDLKRGYAAVKRRLD